jgi:predicted RNA-binding Zn-ribbon protein involved in translation (DUF1610 family)
LKAPGVLAGKQAKCPQCGSVVPIPMEVVDAEVMDLDDGDAAVASDSEAKKKACPKCGEMIQPSAMKCRFCGEILDADLRQRTTGQSGHSRDELKAIASFQKGIIFCILIYFVAVGAQFGLPPQLRPILLLGVLAIIVTSTVFVFRLAMKIYSTGVGIMLGILALLPFLGLLVLLRVNSKATGILKENGIHVGFLGANLSDIN